MQLRCHPLLFCNFKWFNINAATALNPVIQKKVDEILATGSIEPSTGSAVFHSNVFVVPKHTSSL